MENIQLPLIDKPQKHQQQQPQQLQQTKLPSLSKSTTSTSFNSKSNSARASTASPAPSASAKPRPKPISLSDSSSSFSDPDEDSQGEIPPKKNSTIVKYYYLQPLYVHPDRQGIVRSEHRKKHVEIPASMSYKFMSYITNEKWKEALKLCKKSKNVDLDNISLNELSILLFFW